MSRFCASYLELARGRYPEAETFFSDALERCEGASFGHGVARSMVALGSVALHKGRVDDAVARLRASIELARSIGDQDDLTWALELLGVAYAESHGEQAARLLGAAEALRASLGGRLEGIELALHERALAALGDDHEVAWAAGAELSPEEAAELALSP